MTLREDVKQFVCKRERDLSFYRCCVCVHLCAFKEKEARGLKNPMGRKHL